MLRDSGGIFPEMLKPETLIYTGVFLVTRENGEEVGSIREQLLNEIPPYYGTTNNPGSVIAHHLTLAFRPADGIRKDFIGKIVNLKINGYILNETLGVQVAEVEIISDEVSSSNENPHITISVKEGVKPVISNLAFGHSDSVYNKLENPLILNCPVGYFDAEKKEVTSL